MYRLPHGIIIPNRPDPDNVLRMDNGILPMLSEMEKNGMRVDRAKMVALHKTITQEMEELQEWSNQLTGYPTNLGSGDQLSELLYKKLKLRQQGKEKWTKTKARLAADADVLKAMISQHPAIRVILDWKEREKLRSSFTLSLLAAADENDRIHPSLNHTGPETGRLSCSDPNLQTIPTRTKLGKMIRSAFIPSPGMYLGTVDASQIEMRTNCFDSQCKGLMEIFWSFSDLYWGVAEAMYMRKFSEEERKHGVEPTSGLSFKEYYRFNAKTTALAVTYDTSPPGLVDIFLSSVPPAIAFLTGGKNTWDYDRDYKGAVDICGKEIVKFFKAYMEILTRRRVHHRRARKYKMVWDMWGRHRWIPQVRSTHQWVQGEGDRAAGNMAGQGGAAGVVKLWMIVVWDRLVEYWMRMGIRPLMQIHDELIFEGPKAAMEDFLEEAKYLLANLIPYEFFNVPLESSGGMGLDWASLEK